MEDKKKLIAEKTAVLNRAARAYYQDAEEIMSNYEYDKLYDELLQLEKETGIVMAGSPTQKVGYEVASELPKEAHQSPMLSLDKTKSRQELREEEEKAARTKNEAALRFALFEKLLPKPLYGLIVRNAHCATDWHKFFPGV